CWVKGSIEACPVDGAFGLIFCAIDSFLHLTTDAAQRDALRHIHRLLRPDGCLALDLPTLAAWSDWQPGVRPLELLWSEQDSRGVTTAHFTTFRAEPATQTRHVTHIFEEIQPDGVSRRWPATYEMRFIGRYELELLLREAGLRVTGLHGDYELGPLLPDSERMIVLAGRAPHEEG
ncbi:MAG: class I SAM-dependent methyltransferase, partial [Dehalococcoidia bacterium]